MMRKPKCIQIVFVTWPSWPPHPYMVKTFKKTFSLELELFSIGDVGPTKSIPNGEYEKIMECSFFKTFFKLKS